MQHTLQGHQNQGTDLGLGKVWQCYNALPTLFEANKRFSHRSETFNALNKLLSTYQNSWGVCLVHAHCKLTEGEIMLAGDDNFTQPVKVLDASTCHPSCWLPSGEPFEFTTHATEVSPEKLVNEFQSLTKDVGVLGLFYAKTSKANAKDGALVEWTEGRSNLVRPLEANDLALAIETAWILADCGAVPMTCKLYCITETTDRGGSHTGK